MQSRHLILSVELDARSVRAVLASSCGNILARYRCVPGQVERELTAWITSAHRIYGAELVVVGRRGRHWTPSLIGTVKQAGGRVELLEASALAEALAIERQWRDVSGWSRRLSLQSALWNALHESRGSLPSMRWIVRDWARDRHQWEVHCLDADEFDEICRAGEEVPF